MKVISASGLPQVSARAAAASRAAGRWLGGGDRTLTARLGGIGAVRVTFDGFETFELPSREELLLVGTDGRRGRIAVDRSLALMMVSATLGRRAATAIVRRLGAMERGVLAALVVPFIARLNGRVAVGLDPPTVATREPLVSLGATIEALGTRGRARVDVPVQWLPAFDADATSGPPLTDRARGFSVIAPLVLATTRLTASDWAASEVGDAIVFEGVAYPGSDANWTVSLEIGDYSAAALFGRGGVVSISDPFLVTVQPARVRAAAASSSHSHPKENLIMGANVNDQNLAMLAAAPVEVIAEVGRLTLRGDEILGLGPGSVLSFGGRDGLLTITAGGQSWARGELVDVEGELGVRITELLRS
jgi:type III secretion system YscQ/HrcQ family protein